MSDLPNLTPEQVSDLLPEATDIEVIGRGGQKLVFKGTIDGQVYALKFARMPQLPEEAEEFDPEGIQMSDVEVRAQREVETMYECTSRHMVKLGPVGLNFTAIDDQELLYFSEEYIDGGNLQIRLRSGRFPSGEIVKLGLHITDAIQALWERRKIHRDIKPANIMQRGDDYVLLDAGFAFDVVGDSLSIGPVGTPPYFSPEQFDFSNRRTVLDFRSDLFSLGVTMYQLATGEHPFWAPGDTSQSLYNKIRTHNPQPPSDLVPGFPNDLDEIILRMLAKSPHLRYRRCRQLIDSLKEV